MRDLHSLFKNIKTPAYIIDEAKLRQNCEILADVERRSGAKILLAQKAFSAFATYPLISQYISGATSSGLFEARLAQEEMGGQNHVFSPAYTDEEMQELCRICDHIVFNSLSQLEHHRKFWQGSNVSVGLRLNPEHSTQDGHEIYDPCSANSRLGVRQRDMTAHLPSGVEGLHIHTLCEQMAEPLVETVAVVEEKFGHLLREAKWLNLGGGHHITKSGYDIEKLISLVIRLRETYDLEIYLEPGEAVALDAGYLATRVMDIVKGQIPILILDTSAACHMPDVIEMPYTPPLLGAGAEGEKPFTYCLATRTCLAGDVIGNYSFDKQISIGDMLIFCDMAIYSMVKNNTFNGMPLPDIAILKGNGEYQVVKTFGYKDFKERLS